MGDHQAQRDLGMAGQGGTDGGMAVQVDIGLASAGHLGPGRLVAGVQRLALLDAARFLARHIALMDGHLAIGAHIDIDAPALALGGKSEEHTSELQSLMRISYAVFCLKKKKQKQRLEIKAHIHIHLTTYTTVIL